MALSGILFEEVEEFERTTNDRSDLSEGLFESLSLGEQSQTRLDAQSSDNSKKSPKNGKNKRFVCFLDSCRKEFSQFCSLQKHERIHRGEKPYVCKTCDHAFTQLSNLKRHERLHTGEKPHACEFCPKTFSNVSNLKQHLQIHEDNTNRSKFICRLCSRSYYYQSSLKKHMREHGGKVKLEEIESVENIELDDFPVKSEEDSAFGDSMRKIVKIEIGSDDTNKRSIEIDLQINEHEARCLPQEFRNMLLDTTLMRQMMSIAFDKGTNGGTSCENPVDAFEKIRHGLSGFFPSMNHYHHVATPATTVQTLPLIQTLPYHGVPQETLNNEPRIQDLYKIDESFLNEDYGNFYSKNRATNGYNPCEIKNYLEDFDASADSFFRLENVL